MVSVSMVTSGMFSKEELAEMGHCNCSFRCFWCMFWLLSLRKDSWLFVASCQSGLNFNIILSSLLLPLPFITVRNSSCGKVMFSQACVKNSVHREGGMHGRGMCGRGHVWFGGHVWWGAMHGSWGGMCGKRACMAGGYMHGGGMCGGGVHDRRDSHCSGRYASYWNAFLYFL